jgi:hypothetical protein
MVIETFDNDRSITGMRKVGGYFMVERDVYDKAITAGCVFNLASKRKAILDIDRVYGILGLLDVNIKVDYKTKKPDEAMVDLCLTLNEKQDYSWMNIYGDRNSVQGKCVLPSALYTSANNNIPSMAYLTIRERYVEFTGHQLVKTWETVTYKGDMHIFELSKFFY